MVEVTQVEFIIMGGTFMSMPEEYRNKFVAQLHNALSGFTGFDVDEAVRFVLVCDPRTSCYSFLEIDIPNKANQKQLVLQLKLDLIIAFDRILGGSACPSR